jgi:putative PIN family toxin of toxin-antitoxin system
MKIVLDTNVLVSGLIQPFGPSGQIVRLVAAGELAVCHDSRILTEYREVLFREKFRFDPERVDALLDEIRASGIPVRPALLLSGCRTRMTSLFWRSL